VTVAADTTIADIASQPPAAGPEAGVDTATPEAPRRRLPRVPPVLVGIVALGLATLYYTSTQDSFNMFVFDRVLFACFGAIALNVLMGTGGQVSVGNAAFLLIGAMTSVYFLRSDVPFPLDVVLAAFACGVVGLIVAIPAVRLVGLFLALATLALHFISVFFASKYQATVPEAASAGFTVPILFSSKGLLGGQRAWAWLLFVLLSILLVCTTLVVRNKTGRAWRIMRDHELVAPTFGINVIKYKLSLFVVTSMVIGFAGALTGHFSGSVNVDTFTLTIAIEFVAMILIGGLDSIAGAVIGAFIVTALPAYVPRWTTSILGAQRAATQGPQIAQMIYGALVILFITASPEGIAGWFRGLRSWRTGRIGRLITRSRHGDAQEVAAADVRT
jgi:branched-chain amino acid transport system permease protein